MFVYDDPEDIGERGFKGIWIPREIWEDTNLNMLEKGILMEIDSLDSSDSGCYATNDYLANFCQCSGSKVSSAISKLIKLGYIECVSFDGRRRQLKSCIAFSKRQPTKNYKAAEQNLGQRNIDRNIARNSVDCNNRNPYYNPFGDPSDAPDTPQQNPLLTYAEANLKSLSYGNRNELMRFMEKLPEDVIRHVIDETCAVGVSNWAYVRKVLRSYIDDGITTMAQVEAREKQREEERRRAERNRQAQQAAEENPLARAKFY